MTVSIIQPTDLHESDFRVSEGKVRINNKPVTFDLYRAGGSSVLSNEAIYQAGERHQLQVINGFGKIHLDFKTASNYRGIVTLFALPPEAPRPSSLIEVQVFDGGSIWMKGGDDIIYASGLNASTRYVVDIVGFFPATSESSNEE